ncbi:hypothetical protein [Desulfuromonas sp. TF]|jgi:hypothetical protein|uniref:hypothetical protein n=1 Tax=Desulfuromonas sp. TF TaxID=1232410 RepID=UPI0003FE0F46|nr:hypothetical protein [Desulfuromonas sp. TF]
MNNKQTLTVIVSALVITAGMKWAPVLLKFKEQAFTEVLTWLGCLAGIALIMERAIEVFLSAWRGGDADLQDLQIEKVKEELRKLTGLEPAASPEEARRRETRSENLQIELKNLTETRTRYRIRSRNIAHMVSLVMGMTIAALGLGVLQNIIDPRSIEEIASTRQGFFLKATDILLTGSVLAGGSEAINKLTKVYTTYMNATAQKVGGQT